MILKLRLIFLLLLLFLGSCTATVRGENLPGAISELQPDLLKSSNIIFSGAFATGRSPCEELPDSSRRWFLTTGFGISQVYRGAVKSRYIEVHLDSFVTDPKLELQEGENYFVLLKTKAETTNRLLVDEYLGFQDAILDDEVLAILSDKGKIIYETQDNK